MDFTDQSTSTASGIFAGGKSLASRWDTNGINPTKADGCERFASGLRRR
jgi:hypothetical protein